MVFMMEVSLTEQFSLACNDNKKCINTVDEHMPACFDKNLASATLKADKKDKRHINTRHILNIQSCLSKKSSTNYWKKIDMPAYILNKLDN